MKLFVLKILPFFILEWLTKRFCTTDEMIDGSTWYRLFEAKKPLHGAGVLIRKGNAKMEKTTCCRIGCENEAVYHLFDSQPIDNDTVSCTEHVGYLLNDNLPIEVYRFVEPQLMEK